MIVRLVTLNVGLLRVLGGRIEPAPFVETRLQALPAALRPLNADIIALQEIYEERHKKVLIEALRETHPYAGYVRERRLVGLESGLMVLSSRRLSVCFERFRSAVFDEKLFDQKGLLVCRVEAKEGKYWSLVNIHTSAGGLFLHPESSRADLIRSRQIEQITTAVYREPGVALIVGDLNAGPRVSRGNFHQLLDAGFVSVYDALHADPVGTSPTWDPANPLNRNGPHRICPPQRIDHIFAKKIDIEQGSVVPVSGFICCREPVVSTPGGYVTVSDHFGLCVDVEICL